ncbi:uncharacterized protein FOMMEDRAFT_165802 [Fomitiporia mediterranea MF3/22]|uniref:uncharacterized protein n=1 Tax=Fomitiporia mediterranea (strain MF3/22) TaxID=694068 RepID=UPI0004409724|nr:uncharacterized protein FOMMEDRAFT_165802 [Fomitiporia mediterranea MF3/22]EJD05348.1 hypothetical protein FOMMEDRAFT_165802 [Fomitiporia mediterranea MF3/22]
MSSPSSPPPRSTSPSPSSSPRSQPRPAVSTLRALLNQTLRVTCSDGRVFVGTFVCVDKQLNLILANTDEYSANKPEGRYVTMVMVPWRLVVSVEAHDDPTSVSSFTAFVAMVSPSPPIPSTSSSFPVSSDQTTPSKQSNTPASSGTSSTALVTPPELEQTLSMLSSHRTVLGYLLLSRSTPVRIIRHSGVVFDGEQGRKYASAVSKIVEAVHSGLEHVGIDGGDTDEVRFMRIRTKRHELMISPDERYLLAVLHDPTS